MTSVKERIRGTTVSPVSVAVARIPLGERCEDSKDCESGAECPIGVCQCPSEKVQTASLCIDRKQREFPSYKSFAQSTLELLIPALNASWVISATAARRVLRENASADGATFHEVECAHLFLVRTLKLTHLLSQGRTVV